MGLNITTDDKGVKIYKKEHEGANGKWYSYSLMISSKTTAGDWKNGFIDCIFKKGVSVENKSKIKINNAFFTANESNGKTYVKLMITDFEVLEGGSAPDDFVNIAIDSEDVPFC